MAGRTDSEYTERGEKLTDNKLKYRIAFFAKDRPFMQDALQLLELHFQTVDSFIGSATDPFPLSEPQSYDYLVSYLSPWIIPVTLLQKVRIAHVNFHPGDPRYPGIGCTNFALYNEESEYGITAHYMAEKVDTGPIILVERFPVFPNDTVYTLTQRCYAYIYHAFTKLFPYMLRGEPFPIGDEQWQRSPYRRRELEELCRITPDMPPEEIRRRVRACSYPGYPGAYVELGGVRFEAQG